MEQSVLISIIVPIYNTSQYLERCVRSICNQTYKNLEIILVDDGSTDGSGAQCDRLAELDKRITVYHKANGGLSDARNYGIDRAHGEYIGFVDSDDYIEPTMYEVLLQKCIEHRVKMACCGRFDEYVEHDRKENFVFSADICWSAEQAIENLLLWKGVDSAAWDKLYDKTLWENMRYPYGEISEDVPITGKLIEKAGAIVHVGVPLYHYCHRDNSITMSEYSEKTNQVVEHAQKLGKWIEKSFPNLREAYEYFYLAELVAVIAIYQTSCRETRKKYREAYKSNLELLTKNRHLLKRNPYLNEWSYVMIMSRWNVLLGMQYRCKRRMKNVKNHGHKS